MLAVVFHAPGDVRIEEVPTPELPPRGLLIATAAAGVCGSDVRTRYHGSPKFQGTQILGHEVAGTVIASDASDYPVGTKVAIHPGIPCLECRFCRIGKNNMCLHRKLLAADLPGGMAEVVAIPAEAVRAGSVVRVPDRLPLEYAPVAEPLNAVFNGHDRARTGPWDAVFVLGLGPIGILHTATALSRGASPVVAADPSAERVAAAAKVLGDDHVMVMSGGWLEEAKSRGGGRGWDVVVLATTAPQAFATAFDLVGNNGRILAFSGLPKDKAAITIDVNAIHYREIELIGAFGATPRHFEAAVNWLAAGNLDLASFVTSRVSLDHALEAFDNVEHARGIKSLIKMG